MGLFDRQIQFIDDLEKSLTETLKQVVSDFDFVILDYITEKQMYERGIDGDGKRIQNKITGSFSYSRTTIRLKKAKGQPTDRITLRDKKKYHPSIVIDTYSDRFEVSSDVTYAKYLIKRYGKNIMKPTTENMREFFNKYFIPELKRKTNDKITR